MAWYNFWRKPKPKPVPTPTPTPTPTPVPPTKIFGVATEKFSEVADFNSKSGRAVNTYTIYPSFYWDTEFPKALADQISNSGVTPLLSWEPWEPNGNVTQPLYSLKTIVSGKHDTLLNNWAVAVKAWGKPIMISFAPEMNGDWSPWGAGVNGNAKADYPAAYKHIIDLFRAQSVTNVKWVWQANTIYKGASIKPFYPGDDYIDFVAVDGYNWDTTSPEEIFGTTFDQIKTFTSKPIFIGETGCPEYSGKPKWITDFFVMLNNRGLTGFVWFQYNKEQNWRTDSSTAALNAFKTGIATF